MTSIQDKKVPWFHVCHNWIHSTLRNSFKCIACNAEVTDYQMMEYPFLEYLRSDYPYWYDVPCDEIWNKLKTTGYLYQRIHTPNPERVRSWLWDVRLVRKESHKITRLGFPV